MVERRGAQVNAKAGFPAIYSKSQKYRFVTQKQSFDPCVQQNHNTRLQLNPIAAEPLPQVP